MIENIHMQTFVVHVSKYINHAYLCVGRSCQPRSHGIILFKRISIAIWIIIVVYLEWGGIKKAFSYAEAVASSTV